MRTNSRIQLKFVSDHDQLLAVFRFRYRIYVEEMGRKQKYADHTKKWIIDPLDHGCYLLAAYENGKVVGTVRVNFSRNSDIGDYESFYRMDTVGKDHPAKTSICTRMMISPAYRKSMLGPRLAIACFELGMTNEIVWSFLDCNDHLVEFFTGFGCKSYLGKVLHDEYGEVTPMRFNLQDQAHLEFIRSPFLRSFREFRLATLDKDFYNRSGFAHYLNPPQVAASFLYEEACDILLGDLI